VEWTSVFVFLRRNNGRGSKKSEKQNEARQRTALIAAGIAHASRALRQQPNLDGSTRLDLEQKVKRALEQDIEGNECEADVQAQVNKAIQRELKPLQKETREKVRQQLIVHGIAYAKGELDCEEDLDAWERRSIARDVMQNLEEQFTGEEAEADVEAFVDEILDEVLEETGGEDEGED
jgi:hypothetical protein